MKKLVIFGMFIGSFVGSYVPLLWGGSALSMSSILLGGVGGFLGIWIAYKTAIRIGIE
ncbi:MAG TPA: hypothetical protein VF390_01015 [Patescibacteria group bacterium]